MKLHYTWENLTQDSKLLCGKIMQSGFYPTKIIGVKRGGVFLATTISYILDKPVDFIEYDSLPIEDIDTLSERYRSTLFVDCLCDDGKTFLQITKNTKNFKTASIFFNVKQSFQVDYFARRIDRDNEKFSIEFPWQINALS
jgi:hypoxanthine phosphoribosyltransferase